MCVVYGTALALVCILYNGPEASSRLPDCARGGEACEQDVVDRQLRRLDDYSRMSNNYFAPSVVATRNAEFRTWLNDVSGKCGVDPRAGRLGEESFVEYIAAFPAVGNCVMREYDKRSTALLVEYRRLEWDRHRTEYGVPTGKPANIHYLDGVANAGKYLFEVTLDESLVAGAQAVNIWIGCEDSQTHHGVGYVLTAEGPAQGRKSTVSIALDATKGALYGALDGDWGKGAPADGRGGLATPAGSNWRCLVDAGRALAPVMASGALRINTGEQPFAGAGDAVRGFTGWRSKR